MVGMKIAAAIVSNLFVRPRLLIMRVRILVIVDNKS